jgi:hypothetical protein
MAIIEVASDKNPDVKYEVDAETGTCTCPHYTQRLKAQNERDGLGLVCKHVHAVRFQQAEDEQMQAPK